MITYNIPLYHKVPDHVLSLFCPLQVLILIMQLLYKCQKNTEMKYTVRLVIDSDIA